jgi:hypothetical protein
LFILNAEGLARILANTPAVTDDRPYTEFPLWRRLFTPDGAKYFNAEDLRKRLRGQVQKSSSP